MFNLFKKSEPRKDQEINSYYKKLKDLYNYKDISEERKTFLKDTITKLGYLPYPHIKALEELTPAETLFGLEIKWELNKIFSNGHFECKNEMISAVSRAGFKNSDWIKREQHNIKLINLAALGDGNNSTDPGKFIDWLKQLLILPSGNPNKNILATTMYLVPFHPREFGCAYLPTSTGVSENLEDTEVKENLGLEAKEQVQLFIQLSQLAGHPVIYDILPQTGRYSKTVLANPYIARWFDINYLLTEIEKSVDAVAEKLNDEFDPEDVEIIKTIYKNTLHSGSNDLSEFYKTIYDRFNQELSEKKKALSNHMMTKAEQNKLHRRVKEIIANAHGVKPQKITSEDDITSSGQVIQDLIKEGFWPAPGGAWCSAGVPIFDKMSECGSYPTFKHYDYEENDVTHYANLDCQTPYYFVFLETGEYNQPVIDIYINKLKKLMSDYNFDGVRVDHIDHVVDKYSEDEDKRPISYRIPRTVLGKANKALKESNKHFAILGEYMLWDSYYKEYHQDMKCDILWGQDITSQHAKTPMGIVRDNQELCEYNESHPHIEALSIVKAYNNQDGEFRAIDQYPGQLEKEGALFKWFKFKFLPGGKNAQRSVLYVDGDESFTKTGIEGTIGAEISLAREKDYDFYDKFNAISEFAKKCELTTDGEAQIIDQEDDGFVSWMISKDPLKESLLVVANYLPPIEKIPTKQENGSLELLTREGHPVFERSIELPCDYKIVAEIVYDEEKAEFIEQKIKAEDNKLTFEKLEPSEFKIYKLLK